MKRCETYFLYLLHLEFILAQIKQTHEKKNRGY